MAEPIEGGEVFNTAVLSGDEYLPNHGVFLAQMLGKQRGDGLGLYMGRMEPGCEIAREIHPETSETVLILKGSAVGVVGDRELPLAVGEVLHVHKNVHHGLKNAGDSTLEFLVIGHPDF